MLIDRSAGEARNESSNPNSYGCGYKWNPFLGPWTQHLRNLSPKNLGSKLSHQELDSRLESLVPFTARATHVGFTLFLSLWPCGTTYGDLNLGWNLFICHLFGCSPGLSWVLTSHISPDEPFATYFDVHQGYNVARSPSSSGASTSPGSLRRCAVWAPTTRSACRCLRAATAAS